MKYHSYLSPKCTVEERDGEKGVYATQVIRTGDLVAIWGGIIYSQNEVEEIGKTVPHFLTHPVSVYEDFYIGPIDEVHLDDVEFMNHSCNPNVGIKGQIILLARRDIQPDEEVCFDYETTQMSSEPFECECGAENCRKIIDGKSWMKHEFQEQNAGYFSWYIEERIKQLNAKKTT